MQSRFPAEGDLGAIHLEDAGIASWSGAASGDPGARKEAEFHEAAGVILRQIDAIEDRGIAPAEVQQGRGNGARPAAVATQLHLESSIRRGGGVVNRSDLGSLRLPGHRLWSAPK